MKPLVLENTSGPTEQPAELVMETVTMVSRAIRREMPRHAPAGLSMQQFRALRVVNRHPGASLSVVSEHLGLSNATASKLVDALVKQGLVRREESPEDRRVVVLSVTEKGGHALTEARSAALGRLADLLSDLSESDRSTVVQAMHILQTILGDEPAR